MCVFVCVFVYNSNPRFHSLPQISPEDRRGAELDYIKMFGEEWLKAGGRSQLSSQFTLQHPRYLSLIDSKLHLAAPDWLTS